MASAHAREFVNFPPSVHCSTSAKLKNEHRLGKCDYADATLVRGDTLVTSRNSTNHATRFVEHV